MMLSYMKGSISITDRCLGNKTMIYDAHKTFAILADKYNLMILTDSNTRKYFSLTYFAKSELIDNTKILLALTDIAY